MAVLLIPSCVLADEFRSYVPGTMVPVVDTIPNQAHTEYALAYLVLKYAPCKKCLAVNKNCQHCAYSLAELLHVDV